MLRIILVTLLFIGSLSANFFVVDGGEVVEIVNEPIGGADIIGSNGKLLKKYKTLRVAKRHTSRNKYKKRHIKRKRYSSKKRHIKKKRYVSKKKRRISKKRYSKRKKVVKKRSYKKKYSKRIRHAKKKKKTKDYIVIKTNERKLYHYINNRLNKIYDIAVGKPENQHFGTYWISNKKKWPDWIPTKNIKNEFPNLPDIVKGGKYNPLGARALYLGRSAFRIHGTNRPKSIGKAVSHGCFRMRNKDVIKLYAKAKMGTKVYVR